MKRAGIFSAALLILAGLWPAPALCGQSNGNGAGKKPLFIAHYMTWFGLPEMSGQWFQWRFALDSVSADKHHTPDLVLANGRRDIAAVHYPVIGPYDSTDPIAIEYHILLAKEAGIDGFMVNWYGFEDEKGVRKQEDKGFEQLLKTAERMDFKVCVNFDDKCAFPPYRSFTQREEAVAFTEKTLQRLFDTYGTSPAYMRIDGRPVFSNFGVSYVNGGSVEQTSFSVDEWKEIRSFLKAQKIKPYFIHDHQWDWRKTIKEAKFFKAADAIYSWVGKSEDRIAFLEESQKLARKKKVKMVVGLANPGFDNSPCWGWGGGLSHVPRRNGQEYRDQFDECLKYGAGLIHLVTWNDFTEGSTIEPTEEYGDQYLKITAEYANRWNGGNGAGHRFDLPIQIYRLRSGIRRMRQSRLISEAVLKQIEASVQNAVGAYLRHEHEAAEKFIEEAGVLVDYEQKKLPKAKSLEVSLLPASLDLFAGDKAELTLDVKNPYDENVPIYVEVNRLGIPRSWAGELERVVWLKPKEGRKITFALAVPADAPEARGHFTASVDSPYMPVTSNVSYLRIYRPSLRAEIGPIHLLRAGEEEPLALSLDFKQKVEKQANLSIAAPGGWEVKLASAAFVLPKIGSLTVPFSVKIPAGASSQGTITASLDYGGGVLAVKEPFAVLLEKKAVLLRGDINQDGIEDFVLGNREIEVQATPAIGGRILAIIRKESGHNQLFLDYPRVARTSGRTWDKWAEYGGINDWFPGEWPGEVWNDDWSAAPGTGSDGSVSVVFSTVTRDQLGISKEIVVNAAGGEARLRYRLENLGRQDQQVSWSSHPDLAPGGEADKEDLMVVPLSAGEGAGQELSIAPYAPRLQKKHHPALADWILAYDPNRREYIGQRFDHSLAEKIGLWEGKNFFTMEIILKRLTLGAGEKKDFNVDYVVGGAEGLEAAVLQLSRQKE